MAATFFFYDLETSGFSPRAARIMQFAGQRTDMDLKPIGKPVNVLIQLAADVVPSPDAIMITGITPQTTIAEGITEAEFVQQFKDEVAVPGTIFVGYNSVRFDDEFMRCLLYRNFTDAYGWQWQDNKSRWDLLDVVRMVRALRPDGIKWPLGPNGEKTNRLELMTAANGLDHSHAHDALNDVHATIAVAKLIRDNQPDMFNYLLKMRAKKEVQALVTAGQPFVYTSGKYSSDYEKTTVAVLLAERPDGQGALVYDLRVDPVDFADATPEQIIELWRYNPDKTAKRLPVKTLKYNRCPAVAPLGVLDKASQERLSIDISAIAAHFKALRSDTEFTDKVLAALKKMDAEPRKSFEDDCGVDGQLYDGFFDAHDTDLMRVLCAAKPEDIKKVGFDFHDERLQKLFSLYKARNFPRLLTEDERVEWDAHCKARLLDGGTNSQLAKYFARLGELAANKDLGDEKRFLLEELQLYGESIMPIVDDE
jgi:exodeoxyribonuclease-1